MAVSAGSRTRPRDEVSRSVASLVVTTSRRLRGKLKKNYKGAVTEKKSIHDHRSHPRRRHKIRAWRRWLVTRGQRDEHRRCNSVACNPQGVVDEDATGSNLPRCPATGGVVRYAASLPLQKSRRRRCRRAEKGFYAQTTENRHKTQAAVARFSAESRLSPVRVCSEGVYAPPT